MGSRAVADYSLQKTKCVFLGQEDVGKTCILMRFMHDIFDSSYHATIGIDFLSRTIVVDKQTVRLQLWDTAGQERFRSLIPSYIRDSSVSIVVYDVTSRTSFEQTSEWIKRIRETKPNEGIIFLVGNKTDLTEKRAVSLEEGSAKAKKERVHFCETSAKSGTGVNGTLLSRLRLSIAGVDEALMRDGYQSMENTEYFNRGRNSPKCILDDSFSSCHDTICWMQDGKSESRSVCQLIPLSTNQSIKSGEGCSECIAKCVVWSPKRRSWISIKRQSVWCKVYQRHHPAEQQPASHSPCNEPLGDPALQTNWPSDFETGKAVRGSYETATGIQFTNTDR